jgi:hypothetical protein
MPKRIVLNLQQARAEKSITTPVIVDFDGVEHPIRRLDLDAFLEIMEIEQEFEALSREEAAGRIDRSQQLAMLTRLKDLIQVVLPGFPVGGLELEELMAVAQALQASVAPDNAEAEGDSPGE